MKPQGIRRRTFATSQAWTLLEMMISVAVAAVILAAIASTYIFASRTLDATANYAELDRQSRNALDQITSALRQAGAITNMTSTTIWMTSDTNAGSPYPMMLNWHSNTSTLEYTVNNVTNVLLKGCAFAKFSYFKRNPSNDTTMLFFTSNIPSETKVVVMDWICKKTNSLTLTDSESVQTAKVVLRN